MKIFLNNVTSQYDAIGVFVDGLTKGFRKLGVTVGDEETSAERTYEEVAENYDAVISFNGVWSDAALANEMIDFPNLKVFSYLLDHPYHHDKRLSALSQNHHVICLDGNHKKYIEKYCPNIATSHVLPLGGLQGNQIKSYKDRTIPILFAGSNFPSELLYQKVCQEMEQTNPELRVLIDVVIELMKTYLCTMEDALCAVFKDMEVDEALVPEVCPVFCDVDNYIRGYYREQILNTIAKAGYELDLYGNGWEQLESANMKNVHIHPPIDFKTSLDVMGDSKIVLNVMPWFKDGCHDRVISGMLNGAVVLSDWSAWIERNFTQFQEISIFSLKDMEGMLQSIELLQKDESWAEYISVNGQKKSMELHTWDKRAEAIVQIINECK